MISRKTADIITIIYIILLILSFYLPRALVPEKPLPSNDPEALIRTTQITWLLQSLPTYILILTYYVIMLIAGIKLYSKKQYNLLNLIIQIIFVAFTVIFYFVSIRSALKKYESNNGQQASLQTPQNNQGTNQQNKSGSFFPEKSNN
jgi:uncharacterized membrane protein